MKTVFSFIGRYLIIISLVGFVITCNMFLFLNILHREADIIYTEENIGFAAIFTFWNAMFLGLVFTIIDFIGRKYLVKKPTEKIRDFTQRITRGDFSVRLKRIHVGEYNKIVKNLNKMAEELSGIETLRTDFVANVSHEMKTPLSVLQNYAVLLEEPGLSDEKRCEYARNINRVTKHLSELVTNILKLNKLESQKFYPDFVKCNLSEIICECMLGFENEWERKNIGIDIDIESDVHINSDTEILPIVWNNIFSNAIKFTPEGGTVAVRLNQSNGFAVATVTDTGCGMNEETLKHIFDKFYQGDTSHSVPGNGLGLALVKNVLDILGGKISVESKPGIGSTFTVKLPLDYKRPD